jgi:AcrR family transcriptional regulator
MGTKEKILDTAIDLFSQKGFNEVSVRDITRAVGIKESSLYNHFTSKQQILDEIFQYLSSQYEGMTVSEEEAVSHIEKMSPEEFMEMCLMNFQMYLGNPKLMKIWRIISIERFRNEKANSFFKNHLIDYPLIYQSKVFDTMIKRGLIGSFNPDVLARAFYSFILFIYLRYFEDGGTENPQENPEIQAMVRAHMDFLSGAIKK